MKIREMWKRVLGIVVTLIVVIGGVIGAECSQQVHAATPRVMLADYSVSTGDTVVAGKDFTLKLVLRNTAAKTSVRNIKVAVGTENGEFLPTNSAGTAYIEKIDASTDSELEFKMHAVDGLEEKSYKVTVKTEYEDGNGYAYDVTDSIYLNVSLNQRISITDVYLAEYDVQLGDTVEICGTVNNLGKGTLYNVTACIEGDNVVEQVSYIGNIESGKSGTIDALTKADVISHNAGDKNKLTVTYEDKAGNVYSEETEYQILVKQPIYENLEKVKDSGSIAGTIKQIAVIVIVIAVIGLIVLLSYRRWKRKQKMLDEI